MNLYSLGTTLGALWKEHQPSFPDVVNELLADVVTAVDTVDAGIEEFFYAFNKGAGIEDAENEPVDEDEPDYHCRSCKVEYAPVEELTNDDLAWYIERYHPSASRRKMMQLVDDDWLNWTTNRDILLNWFGEALAGAPST